VVLTFDARGVSGRGLHSCTLRLQVSPFCGIRWVVSWIFSKERFRLSWKVDECKPLVSGHPNHAATYRGVLHWMASYADSNGRAHRGKKRCSAPQVGPDG
jgi:hypothetical protein